MRTAIYARVSTADQNCELQLRELQDYVDRHGWQISETYQDIISGAKASRPGLNRLITDAQARKFDCLLVWKLDRFGRSPVDCLNNIRILEDQGIRFIAVTQGLDTDQKNPASRFLLHVLGAAAEFETFADSGADASGSTPVPSRLCIRQGGKDCAQSIGTKHASSPTEENLQSGTGNRTSAAFQYGRWRIA
jgi:hypothetical protein